MTKSYNGRKAVTFYVPDEVLETIDTLAKLANLTRSKYLASKLCDYIVFNKESILTEYVTDGVQIFFNEYREAFMTGDSLALHLGINSEIVISYLKINSDKRPEFKPISYKGLELYNTCAIAAIMDIYRPDLMVGNFERGLKAYAYGTFNKKIDLEAEMEKWGNLDELDISFIKQDSKIDSGHPKENLHKVKRGRPKTKEYVYTPKIKKGGKIYLIGNIEKGVCKIGFSTCVEQRLKGLQTSCPFILEILFVMPDFHTQDDEANLHNHFDEFRLSGEWFTLTDEILEFFRSANES